MNKPILAYAAGMFDGEGCVWISSKPNINIHVSVGNTYEPVCRWFADNFGGTYYLAQRRLNDTKGWKKAYAWRMTGKEAKSFLTKVLPYLIIKKERAMLALTFPTSVRGIHCSLEDNEKRQAIRTKMKELNR